jgi:hypothetical protein
LEIPKERREHFKERLINLLSFETLTVTTTAVDILTEHEHTLCRARILTDVRPIFRDNPEEPDVSKLRDLLIRADAQAQSLKSVLKAADIR